LDRYEVRPQAAGWCLAPGRLGQAAGRQSAEPQPAEGLRRGAAGGCGAALPACRLRGAGGRGQALALAGCGTAAGRRRGGLCRRAEAGRRSPAGGRPARELRRAVVDWWVPAAGGRGPAGGGGTRRWRLGAGWDLLWHGDWASERRPASAL